MPAAKAPGKEVPSLNTATSITWQKPDGGYATRIWARPVNVKNAAGDWTRIDNTLHAVAGGFANGAASIGLKLPSTLAAPVELSHGADKLSLSLRGSAAKASVEGATATFANAAPGVTAKLTANNAALKEDLVLASASAQRSFTYDLRLSAGLTPKVRKDGGIDVVGKDGDVVYTAAAPVAADAKGAVAPASQTSLSVARNGDDWVLTLSLDAAWLGDNGRAFPVTLDPSFTLGASRDCYVSSAASTTNYCTSGELRVGRTAAGAAQNSALLYFDFSGVPAARVVQNAEVDLYPLYQTSPGVAKNLSAHQVTSDWDNSATWVKRTAAANWTTAGGDIASAALDTQALPTGTAPTEFEVNDLAQKWVSKTATNQGIAITDDGSSANNAQVYASSDWSDSSKWPSVFVETWGRMGAMSNYKLNTQSITDRQSLGVNVAGGNLLLTDNELQVDGNRLPLNIARFWNSQDPWDGSVNNGRLSVGSDIVLYDCDGKHDRCFVGPSGFRTRFNKNSDGSFTTPPGLGDQTLTYTGSEYTLTDNASGTTYAFFDAPFSYMTQIRDRDGNHIDFAYHGTNNALSSIVDTRGRTYNVTSNASGYLTSISVPTSVIPGGQTWSYGYDGNGNLTSVTDPENKVTAYRYDANTNIDRITDPRGNYIYIGYDSSERVTSVTRTVDGTTANDLKTTFAYTAPAAPCSTTATIVGSTTTTSPAGRVTVDCWNGDGAVVETYQRYTASPLVWRKSTTSYYDNGNASSFSKLFGTSSPLSTTTTLNYNNTTNPNASLLDVTSPAGGKTSFGYTSGDAALRQNPSSVKTPSNHTYYYGHDNADKTLVTAVSDAPLVGGTPTLKQTITYRSDGQISTVADLTGATTTYNYDAIGQLTSIVPPTGSGLATTTFGYDGLSRLTLYKDGRTGQYVNFTYDKLGRTLTAPDSDGQNTTLVYDADGNVTTRSDPQTSSSYTYDMANRKTSETLSGVTNGYTYDKDNNLATLTDASGLVTYNYDTVARLTSIVAPTASSGNDTTSYAYNDPTTTTPTNVVETLPGNGTITKNSDYDGKLTDLLVKNSAGTQTKHYSWSYAMSGIPGSTQPLVTSRNVQDGGTGATTATTTYGYDIDERITSLSTPGTGGNATTFGYDKANNRTSRVVTPNGGSAVTTTYAYKPGNELCYRYTGSSTAGCSAPPSGAVVPTYDVAGNQLTGDGNTTSWDAKGRIDGLNGNYSRILSPSNSELIAFGSGASADTYTNTVLGVGRIAAGSDLSKYVRSVDGKVVSQVRASTKEWLVTDNLGSTIGLVDGAGNVQRTYAYDADGNATSTGTGPESWIRYAGGQLIGSTGLYHFASRYYSPVEARWTQQDTLDQPFDLVQANAYAYVGNNPINGTDASGLFLDGVGDRISNAYKSTKHWVKNTAVGRCVGGAVVAAATTGTALAVTAASAGTAALPAAGVATSVDAAAAGGCIGGGVSKAVGL